MLNFREITIEDASLWNSTIAKYNEISAEADFASLLIWKEVYPTFIAQKDGNIFIKTLSGNRESYRLPFGGDMAKGLKELELHCGKKPCFWNPLGELFHKLPRSFKEDYEIVPTPDSFDYIYLREELATLSGKKFHSKRNHISAFSKKYAWHYEKITQSNKAAVLLCAEEWYAANSDRLDKYMLCEKRGIELLLENPDTLRVRGGAIVVDGRVVAFTLGTPINSTVFDTHIEKALPDFAEGYTVINREFALNELADFKYINREDDMGLEGLRRAKLSYRPKIILEKYYCKPREVI